jgi:hypothetical protein
LPRTLRRLRAARALRKSSRSRDEPTDDNHTTTDGAKQGRFH